MRLFIAINFSEKIKNQILELQEQLRSQSSKGNFTKPANFHITLAFLGETPEEKIESICRIIDDIQITGFELCFNHTGCFTHSRKELWWVGADPKSPGLSILASIQGQLIDRLLKAGFSVDTRPFRAHITLGREIKHPSPIYLSPPRIIVNVRSISLMKSDHVSGGMRYTDMYTKL